MEDICVGARNGHAVRFMHPIQAVPDTPTPSASSQSSNHQGETYCHRADPHFYSHRQIFNYDWS